MLVVETVYKMMLNPLMDHRPFSNNGVKLAPSSFFVFSTLTLSLLKSFTF